MASNIVTGVVTCQYALDFEVRLDNAVFPLYFPGYSSVARPVRVGAPIGCYVALNYTAMIYPAH